MIDNNEFQKLLKKYPGDLPVAIAITWNDVTSLFYDLKVKGVSFEGNKAVLIINEDVNMEYKTLMNGAEVDEEVYREQPGS